MNDDITYRIKKVLAEYAELDQDPFNMHKNDDLFSLGMRSRVTIGVMLGLESEFNVEFPDAMLRRDVFKSIQSIEVAILSLTTSS